MNGWLQLEPEQFRAELTMAVDAAVGSGAGRMFLAASLSSLDATQPIAPAPDLRPDGDDRQWVGLPEPGSPLEPIYYRCVLIDDPVQARENIARIGAALADSQFDARSSAARRQPGGDLQPSVKEVLYRHVLVDDRAVAAATLAQLKQEVARWDDKIDRGAGRIVLIQEPMLAESIMDSSLPKPPDLGVAP